MAKTAKFESNSKEIQCTLQYAKMDLKTNEQWLQH